MDHQHESVPNTASSDTTPHVVIFPFPIQGPVNCMLKLAELLLSVSQASISVTFLNTDFIQRQLELNSSTPARLASFGPCFGFETVQDGLGSDDNPRGEQQLADITHHLGSQAQDSGSRLRKLLAYGLTAQGRNRKPVTCIIADGFFWFMADVTKEIGVPLVYFETVSPAALWTDLCLPKMLQAGDLPFQGRLGCTGKRRTCNGNNLRHRDLPGYYQDYDPNNEVIQLVLKGAQHYVRAQGHILNTFDDLEDELLGHVRGLTPNMYTIGPIHLNLKSRVKQEPIIRSTKSSSSFSNSIWQEDRSCLAWLDSQPLKSVLFVSIGSLAVMTKDQLMEFWHGLVNSRTRFLWVRRPKSIIGLGDDEEEMEVSNELLEGTRDRGCLVSWAPQEEVLTHSAIGGFLTHSGWNSTLESMVAGVPMICWPFFIDQQVNSRLVSEVWKIGLDMKDTCSRVLVETLIRDLMGTRKDEFLAKANKMAKLATRAASEDGSSYYQLTRLIDDITFMRFPVANSI